MNSKGIKFQIIKIIAFCLSVALVAIMFAQYLTNDELKEKIDSKIFRQEVMENDLNLVEIDAEDNLRVYALGKYIVTFGKNKLNFYSKNADLVQTVDIKLNNPIDAICERYCVLADEGDNRLFLIDELGIEWENEVTGFIYQIHVNSNGYVTVISKDAMYESIITIFDCDGNKLYTKFLATGYAISAILANNNNFLAIGKIDYSGVMLKSSIDLISITLSDESATLNSVEFETGNVLVNMKFNSKNELICMFDSFIQKITESSSDMIYEVSNGDIFVDISLENNIIIAQKESTGIFSYEYKIKLDNTLGKSNSMYILENDIPKKIISSEKICCIRFANEIRFINSNGWLIKKYKTSQNIKNIVIGSEIAGIVYNNKIEVISF